MNMTRRQFLASAGGAVALCGHRAMSAGDAPRPGLTFALVSDTHLGRKGSRSPAKWMGQVVEEINASAAEMTVFLGDLVDTGARNEGLYPEWVTIAKGLKRPFYAVAGNHDPGDFFRKYVRPHTDYHVDHKGFRFVFFQDTRTDSHLGTVGLKQLNWLERHFAEAAARKLRVFLCAHITAHPNKHPDTGWWVRSGGKELRELLRDKGGAVIAFLAGHFHCGLRGWGDLAGIHELVLPSTAWNVNRGLGRAPGFALSEFRRGWVLAEVRGGELALSYKPIGAAAKAGKRLPLRTAAGQSAVPGK